MNVIRLVKDFPSINQINRGLSPTYYLLSKEQVAQGIKIHLVCRRAPRQKSFEEIEGIKIHRFPGPYNLYATTKVISLNRLNKIDVVHTHATSCLSYSILRSLFRKCQLPKHVTHVHGTSIGVVESFKKFDLLDKYKFSKYEESIEILKEKIMWRNADACIAVSNFVKDDLIKFYEIPEEKIYVIYNGVNLDSFYPRKNREKILKSFGLAADHRIILYLGGYRPVKGPSFAVEAFRQVFKENKKTHLIFVGNPNEPLERSYAEPIVKNINSLDKGAIFRCNYIPNHELPDFYSAADAVVLPSTYEAFPKVILEAMACGSPVIASNVGGIPEVIRNGENGLLVKPTNSEKLAEAILDIVANQPMKERISSNAMMTVKKFSWANTATDITKLYQKLLT